MLLARLPALAADTGDFPPLGCNGHRSTGNASNGDSGRQSEGAGNQSRPRFISGISSAYSRISRLVISVPTVPIATETPSNVATTQRQLEFSQYRRGARNSSKYCLPLAVILKY